MSEQYKRALRACYDGLLKMRQDDNGHQLFCYTQDCFFGKDTWNDLTKNHRGALYYEAEQVNKPFSKIFNLGEQPETELDVVLKQMEKEPYQILDKANGHLFIVSCFLDKKGEQHVVFHTKGGLPGQDNDLLNDDIKIFWSKFGEKMDDAVVMFPNSTWMFEAIVSHDKHTMYKQQVEAYGDENTFVLLGVNIFYDGEEVYDPGWHEASYDDLDQLSSYIGCPRVVSYDSLEGTPDTWLEHTNREGYVIHFTESGDRVKIKTREYWAMRFKKDLTAEHILSMFKKSGDNQLRLKLPEEVADEIMHILDNEYKSWWYNEYVEMPKIGGIIFDVSDTPLTTEQRAELFKDDSLTTQQKQTIAAVSDKKSPVNQIWSSKKLRNQFYEWMLQDSERLIPFQKELEMVVDTIGES